MPPVESLQKQEGGRRAVSRRAVRAIARPRLNTSRAWLRCEGAVGGYGPPHLRIAIRGVITASVARRSAGFVHIHKIPQAADM